MAFEPLEIKIIPKGINLLPPGDQVEAGDCLELTNWWPGSTGRLQQARGFIQKNGTQVSAQLDSLAESDGQVFYGGGGSLWQVGHDSGGAAIDTGYDGQPLGMCAYQHVLWVMNRAKQRRIGTGPNNTVPLSDWGAAAAAPTIPAGVMSGGGSLADGDHTYYVTFVDEYGYETNPSPALVLTAPSLTTPGFSDGTVAVTEGSTAVTLTPSATSGWTSDIDGQQFLVPSEYPTITPPAAAPYTIAYVDATHGTLSAPWVGLSNGALAYQIYSTSDSGKATITRPDTTDPTVTGWNVYHQSPGINGPYQVNLNGPLVYTGTIADPNQTADNTYVDYGDSVHGQDDTTLLDADVLMEEDHDPPPAATVMAPVPYNGRLVAANSAANPNRIWYTNPLEPNYFPGSTNPQAGNWVDIGADTSDGVLNLSVRSGMLLVYRQRSIWQIVGDFADANSTIGPLVPNMGVVGPRAVVGTSNGDLAVVRQGVDVGIYRVTDWEQRIGAKVEPILNGLGAECYPALSAANNNTAMATCALGYKLGRLWFSYPDGTATAPTRTLVCDIEQDTFSWSVAGRWFSRWSALGGFGAFLHGSLFFLGTAAGKVYSLEDGAGDEDGNAPFLGFQSAYVDGGKPDHEKTFGDLVIAHQLLGASLTVSICVNKGADVFTLATIASSLGTGQTDPFTNTVRQIIPMLYPTGHANAGKPIEGFNAAVRIEGSGPQAFPGAVIDGPIIMHAFLKPRRAMSWDSGPTDHNITGAKVIDAFEIDFDGSSGLTLFVQSDIPGGAMVERTSGGTGIAVSGTSGRQVKRVILPSPVSGRVLRYQLYAAGGTPAPFLLYKVRVRAVPIGIYVDGTFGDTWYTEPIAAGTGGVAPVYEAARRERLPQEV